MDRDKLIAELEADEPMPSGSKPIRQYLEEVDASTAAEAPTSPTDSEAIQAAVAKIRHKKTKTGKVVGTGKYLDKSNSRLTLKQKQFASNYQKGQSPVEAYRNAYQNSTSTDAVVMNLANKLLNDERVKRLLGANEEKAQEILVDDMVAARRWVMERLIEHAKHGKAENTQLKALELMGRAVSMFTDKVEQKVEEVNVDKLKAELQSSLTLLDKTGNVQPIRKRSA